MVKTLAEKEYEEGPRKFLTKLCFEEPRGAYKPSFRESTNLNRRLILFPLGWTLMESDFSKEIHEILVQEGESGYYVTSLWIPPDRRKVLEKEKNDRFHRFHWYVPLGSFWDVIDKLPTSDTVCYSESCRWVIVLGEDKLALVACDEQFYSTLLAKIPDAEAKVHEFLKYVVRFECERSDTENWISPLLHHIYAEERANELLNQYGY